MEASTMQSDKKTLVLLISLAVVFLLSGCSAFQKPAAIDVEPDLLDEQQSDPVANRFQESSSRGRTAVESAIELSQRHAILSEEAATLRQQKQDFTAENQQLKGRVDVLGAQLQQTQKELTEANDLLIEMRIELNNWKTDILGFRNDMRDAETAQLEALLKILRVLGGEIETASAKGGDIGSAVASSRQADRP
jgi:chromosome segregation ATPase